MGGIRKRRKTHGEFRIVKWEFDNPSKEYWKRIEVPVYYVHEREKDEPAFKAIVPMIEGLKGYDAKDVRKTLEITADSLGELECAVESFIKFRTTIVWKGYIRVHIDETYKGPGWEGYSAGFGAETIDIGEDEEGNAFWRNSSSAPPQKGDPRKYHRKSRGGSREYNYIEDTPENREVLEHLARAFNGLEIKLQEFLNQDDWLDKLRTLGQALLPEKTGDE